MKYLFPVIPITLFWMLNLASLMAQQNGIYNIQDFGAKGDGISLNTQFIQKAIDECAQNGGGKVIVPPGRFLTDLLFLKSNLSFKVFPGATLIFDDDIANCPIVDGR
jgi:polygalacturonase